MRWKTPSSMRLTVLCVAAFVTTLPLVAQAAPCAGTQRLQLRWSKASATAMVAVTATLCDQPPSCSDSQARAAGTLFTKSPITVTIKDARGHSVSSVVDAGAASCAGRCERINRGGCLGGTDTHRLASSFVRYAVNKQGKTSVVANKLKIPMAENPDLVTPITVTITDAAGYALTAELRKCRVRQSANAAVIGCS